MQQQIPRVKHENATNNVPIYKQLITGLTLQYLKRTVLFKISYLFALSRDKTVSVVFIGQNYSLHFVVVLWLTPTLTYEKRHSM